MQVELHCEACRVLLNVPCEAAGHRARCPSCGHQFTVPQVDALLEDKVSEWIEHDVEEILQEHDRAMEEQLRQERERQATEAAAHAAEAGAAPPVESAGAHGHGNGHDKPRDAEAHAGPTADDPADRRTPRRLWPMRSGRQPSLPDGVPLPAGVSAAAGDRPAPTPASHDRDHDGEQSRYPSNLHLEERVPHLVIRRVDAAGVRFAFDSRWLGHDGFRASMPVRCVFSGSSTREKLIARPVVFMDRATAAAPGIDRINSAHENRQVGDHSPRHLMRMMGLIEGFTQPFAYAMPYYVSNRYAHLQIHCQTRDRVSGGVTCEVLIPDALCALDWLARVNGVCGKEYELLEHDVGLRHGDAWQQLAEETRQRVATWCKLGSREILMRYFSDADFGKRDEGLAGLVITDQRLVFSKYHHRGQVRLDNEDTAIIARGEGKFVNLTLRIGKDLHRMIKLHRHDLDALTQALAQNGRIRVEHMQEA